MEAENDLAARRLLEGVVDGSCVPDDPRVVVRPSEDSFDRAHRGSRVGRQHSDCVEAEDRISPAREECDAGNRRLATVDDQSGSTRSVDASRARRRTKVDAEYLLWSRALHVDRGSARRSPG